MIYSLKVDTMNKCTGCGAYLQIDDPKKPGYTVSLEHTLCNRCFRINNYNEYQKIEKTNNEFIPILKKINENNDIVILGLGFIKTTNPETIKIYSKYDLEIYTRKSLI